MPIPVNRRYVGIGEGKSYRSYVHLRGRPTSDEDVKNTQIPHNSDKIMWLIMNMSPGERMFTDVRSDKSVTAAPTCLQCFRSHSSRSAKPLRWESVDGKGVFLSAHWPIWSVSHISATRWLRLIPSMATRETTEHPPWPTLSTKHETGSSWKDSASKNNKTKQLKLNPIGFSSKHFVSN